MMVDLREPLRRSYSQEEEESVRKNFLLILFGFLAVYLALHNLIVPFAINALKGRDLLIDIHFWFLSTFALLYWLRKGTPIPRTIVMFLILGSLARLGFYNFFFFSRSWTLVSVYLSEISTLIFCGVIWQRTFSDRWLPLAFLGAVIPPLLSMVELVPAEVKVPRVTPVREVNYAELGCEGSLVKIDFTELSRLPVRGQTPIIRCGFSQNSSLLKNGHAIVNRESFLINLRLYRLHHRDGKLFWKFVRLLQVPAGTTKDLSALLKDKTLYLLKSPEMRKLGMLVLVSPEVSLTGALSIDLDSIKLEAP